MPYTGQPLKRFEDPKLVTGQGSFVDDIQLPDMLHAAILRSPHAHARIRAIDSTEARHMAGVVTVLTGGTAGVYYPLGDALSKIFSEKVPNIRPTVQATKASVENLNLLQQGRGEVAFTLGAFGFPSETRGDGTTVSSRNGPELTVLSAPRSACRTLSMPSAPRSRPAMRRRFLSSVR